MTWNVSGNSADLLISATAPLIRGKGALDPRLVSDPADLESGKIAKAFERMRASTAEWRLLPASSVSNVLGQPHAELNKRASAGGCVAEVCCFDEGANHPLSVSFNIVLPEVTFQRAYSLLSGAFFSARRSSYQLSIGFLTFRRPTATVDLPTLTEFLAGRPYFSEEVSVSVNNPERDDA